MCKAEKDLIKKVVIPAAGFGTRLLPATKEQPKEMLPIFTKDIEGKLCLKPLLQIIFEGLYDAGLREFCFITGRGKRSIEDHFSVDNDFIGFLETRGNHESTRELRAFYKKVRGSGIIFANQSEPRGFGDAVYHAKSSTGGEAFLVHAGDDLIVSEQNQHLMALMRIFEKNNAAAAFCVQKVKDPSKYGVIVGEKLESNLYRVKKIIEKPSASPSNVAVVAVYAFTPKIYSAIEETIPDSHGEIQLTDAIQILIDRQYPVFALELNSTVKRIDIGNPQSYLKAFSLMARTPGSKECERKPPAHNAGGYRTSN